MEFKESNWGDLVQTVRQDQTINGEEIRSPGPQLWSSKQLHQSNSLHTDLTNTSTVSTHLPQTAVLAVHYRTSSFLTCASHFVFFLLNFHLAFLPELCIHRHTPMGRSNMGGNPCQYLIYMFFSVNSFGIIWMKEIKSVFN